MKLPLCRASSPQVWLTLALAVDLFPALGSAQTVSFALAQSFLQGWNLASVSSEGCPILQHRPPLAARCSSAAVDLLPAWNPAPGFLESQISVKRPPAMAAHCKC